MTEAERSELDMLEGRAMRRELTEFERNRLHFLRLRASGACTWREVLDQIANRLKHTCVFDEDGVQDQECLACDILDRESPWLQRLIRERHDTMLPPAPSEDEWKEQE